MTTPFPLGTHVWTLDNAASRSWAAPWDSKWDDHFDGVAPWITEHLDTFTGRVLESYSDGLVDFYEIELINVRPGYVLSDFPGNALKRRN